MNEKRGHCTLKYRGQAGKGKPTEETERLILGRGKESPISGVPGDR